MPRTYRRRCSLLYCERVAEVAVYERVAQVALSRQLPRLVKIVND